MVVGLRLEKRRLGEAGGGGCRVIWDDGEERFSGDRVVGVGRFGEAGGEGLFVGWVGGTLG